MGDRLQCHVVFTAPLSQSSSTPWIRNLKYRANYPINSTNAASLTKDGFRLLPTQRNDPPKVETMLILASFMHSDGWWWWMLAIRKIFEVRSRQSYLIQSGGLSDIFLSCGFGSLQYIYSKKGLKDNWSRLWSYAIYKNVWLFLHAVSVQMLPKETSGKATGSWRRF